MTRIFDYLSGGSANFEIDRIVANQMSALMPSLPNWARLRRAFVSEAAPRLKSDGFEQFLDLGTGMPCEDLIHTFVNDAAIIYSDINIVAISYSKSYFSKMPLVEYIYGDARELDDVFNHQTVTRLLNPERKIAIGLNFLPIILPPDDLKHMAYELYEWASVGSQLFLIVLSREDDFPETYSAFRKLTESIGMPLRLHSLKQNLEMLAPWKPLVLEPITTFLGLPIDFDFGIKENNISITFHAALFVK